MRCQVNKECLLRRWSATRQRQSARITGNRLQIISSSIVKYTHTKNVLKRHNIGFN